MAKMEAWDSKGNIYYMEGGVPVNGVIDPDTGLFVPGVESLSDLEGITRDPFTGEALPDIDAISILPRVGRSLVKIFQYLWHAVFVVPVKFWLPIMGQWLGVSYIFYTRKFIAGVRLIIPTVTNDPSLPQKIKDQLLQMLQSDNVSEVLTGLGMFIPWYSAYGMSFINVMNTDANRDMMKKFVPTLLDAPMYTNLLFRQPDRGVEIKKYLEWLGVSGEQQDILRQTIKPILQISELAGLRWRAIIDEAGFVKGLNELGYGEDEANKLSQLIWIIPPVNDLVRFAVREAFTPEIIDKYELGANFPPDFAAAAKKVGLSEEWSKRYWYAHWELPSTQMGFEMLHRRVIGKADMDLLLRTKDVMPYWRDKITEVSYRPYSRVDVRRMRKLGVLKVTDVVDAYKDIGYSPEKAQKMAEFTELYNRGAEKHLSKSEFLGGFVDNIISESDCGRELIGLGYSKDEAKLLIDRTKLKKFKKEKLLSLGNVKKMYVTHLYSEIDAIEQMAKLEIQSDEMADLIKLWDLERKYDVKILPEPKLQQLLQKEIITSQQWVIEMKKLNYTRYSIYWLHKLYMGEPPPELV